MSKFTKGTWMPSNNGTSNCVDVIDSTGHRICEFFDCLMWHEDEAEDKANIRLIAAAPEMYRLLKAFAECLHEDGMFGLMEDAQELIARIDGEEEQS